MDDKRPQRTDESEIEHKKFVDWKDVGYLRKFVNPHAKMLGRRRTQTPMKRQRELANAIKRARFMALMPYIAR